jgi:acyl-CoA thioesterase-2
VSQHNPILDDLVQLLALERLEVNLFRGQSRDIGSKQVFGGQVLGQALSAASYTVEDRIVHSLHSYFLRPGDMHAPIIYEVDRQRDGRSFSNRRVVAIQHGRPIFNLAASFKVPEEGLEHQAPMPEVPMPEDLPDRNRESISGVERLPQKMKRFLFHQRPFDFRWVQPPEYVEPSKREPSRQMWFRTAGPLPDNPDLHRAMLAYASDYGLLTTALLPHGLSLFNEETQVVSLDHAMWFHRPFKIDDWLLYAYHSPNASGGRGLSNGSVYSRDGTLVACTAQEGVMRFRPKQESNC